MSADERNAYDFARLERVVEKLMESHRRVRHENAALRLDVEEKAQRIRSLDGQLLDANQRRQDVVKRIDELIAQIDQLEAHLGEAEV